MRAWAQALDGVGTVVHCASDTGHFGKTDVQGTRNLLDAATRTGRPHVIFVSIVGVDRVPLPYYRVKLEVEGLVEAYGGTTLRATQFHDFVLGGARAAARLPIVFVPDVPVQPISTHDVAARLAELVETATPGRVTDLGGPEVLRAPDLFPLRSGGDRQPPATGPGPAARRHVPRLPHRRPSDARQPLHRRAVVPDFLTAQTSGVGTP